MAAAATSPTLSFLVGVPLAITSPSSISRSSGLISISWPATSRICSRTRWAAFSTALPATNVAREANVPVQTGEESVLELSKVTQS